VDGLLASSFAVGLFLLWGVIGHALLSGLKAGLDAGRQLLVAPAVGAAVCVLPIFWASWWGLPVRQFAWPLLAGLTMMAIALLWMRRPTVARGDVWHAALPLGAAFLLNGWPLLTLGFDWLSYSNDDMATYCLMATRLIDHGLVEPPSAAVLQASSDLSATMWLFESVFGRPGPHLLLAWVASIVPKSVVEVYMPVLIAMHLALVAAAGAVVWREPAQRRAAFVTCWLLAASALTALGTVTQLFPQVFGLTLACAFLVLAWDIDRPPFGIGRALGAAVTGASFAIVYPEFAPFVGVPWLGRLLALRLWRRDGRALWTVGAVVVCGLLLAAPYADRFIPFLVNQSAQGLHSVKGSELFPYFRFSTTFANLWGLLPIARLVREPLLSAAIVAGALAFAAVCVVLVRPLRRGDAAPAMLFFILLFSVFLFERGNGFGLFKIAMYAQPFMLGTVALVLTPVPGGARPGARWLALVLIAAVGLPSQMLYLLSSVNPAHARTEIQNQRTAMHDLRTLRDFRGQSLDVDLPVTVSAKLAALFLPAVPLRFIGLPERFRPRGNPAAVSTRLVAEASALRSVVVNATGVRREFALLDPKQPSKSYPFFLERSTRASSGPVACDRILTATAGQTIINRTTTGAADGTFQVLSCMDITNHLAFVSSELGRNYYLAGIDPVSLFGLERDYFFPDRTFAGVGRYLLFEVVHPTPRSRLMLDITTSLKADGANLLPPVSVIGEERLPLRTVGRGAARVYSTPLAAQWIDGHAYVAVDFGTAGTLYPDSRRGLMTWLGRDIPLDSRRLVGLARNISLVSETDYARMTPPTKIERLPQDLSAPALEYSGLYEDGWVAEDAVVVLGRPSGAGMVRVKGTLLPTSSGSGMTVTVVIDGMQTTSERRHPGPFSFDVPLPSGGRDRIAVGLKFSDVRPLSDRDRRPASARIDYLGVD